VRAARPGPRPRPAGALGPVRPIGADGRAPGRLKRCPPSRRSDRCVWGRPGRAGTARAAPGPSERARLDIGQRGNGRRELAPKCRRRSTLATKLMVPSALMWSKASSLTVPPRGTQSSASVMRGPDRPGTIGPRRRLTVRDARRKASGVQGVVGTRTFCLSDHPAALRPAAAQDHARPSGVGSAKILDPCHPQTT